MQELQRLSNHMLYLPPVQETDRPILGAIIGSQRTLIIDAGNSVNHARQFREKLLAVGVKADWLVLTHHHWDHVFGISEVGLPTIAHRETKSQLKDMQQLSWNDSDLDQRLIEKTISQFAVDAIRKEFGHERDIELCLPEVTFEESITLDLGGISCVIEHVGGDHAEDSCVLYIPEEKILFLGDCLAAHIAPDAWSHTVEKSLNLVERLEKFDAEFIFYSHHDVPLSKQEFAYELDVLKNVALLTKSLKGDESSIKKELLAHYKRDLTEDEEETISFFMNGLPKR